MSLLSLSSVSKEESDKDAPNDEHVVSDSESESDIDTNSTVSGSLVKSYREGFINIISEFLHKGIMIFALKKLTSINTTIEQ